MKDNIEQLSKKFIKECTKWKINGDGPCGIRHVDIGVDELWQWILENFQPKTEPSEQKQEWISVKDRLPEYNTEILISYYPKHPTMDGRQKIGINKRLEIVNSLMYSMVNDDGFPKYIGAITHWMPLPCPPALCSRC